MSEKKVSRKIAIGIAILCVVLLISLAGAVINYTSMLNNKDAIISNKNLQIDDKSSQINDLQVSVNAKKAEIDNLTSQISEINANISNLNGQISQKDSQISSLNDQISQKESTIASLNSQISDLQFQKNNLIFQITNITTQIANLQNQLSLSIGTTLETYYQYVRLNCVTWGLEPVDEAQWWNYLNYKNFSVTFAADLAAHDIGQAYWATLETDSGYYDTVGEYSYQTSSRIMQEAMTLANTSSSDSNVVKIDKVLTFINSVVHYENRLLDHMWFPCETLTFHSGDCTGFSILAASMFEEAGIKSAIGFFSNSTIGEGHAMVLVHLDNLGSHSYRYYSDLTGYNLTGGKWIIIEPQCTSLAVQDANLNWIGYWTLEACAEVPYGP
jgi:TolA-binding protein